MTAIPAATPGPAPAERIVPDRYYEPRIELEHPDEPPNAYPDGAPKWDVSFADLLDVVNPLQHIPIVSTIYRAITNDGIHPAASMAGSFIYGGPIGIIASAATTVAESLLGFRADDVLASVFGGDDEPDALLAETGADGGADREGRDPAAGTAAAMAAATASGVRPPPPTQPSPGQPPAAQSPSTGASHRSTAPEAQPLDRAAADAPERGADGPPSAQKAPARVAAPLPPVPGQPLTLSPAQSAALERLAGGAALDLPSGSRNDRDDEPTRRGGPPPDAVATPATRRDDPAVVTTGEGTWFSNAMLHALDKYQRSNAPNGGAGRSVNLDG